MKHQGEFAIQVEMDRKGEAKIVAVQYSGGDGFSMDEVKMAYLEAAVPHIENDNPAVQLFQDFKGTLESEKQNKPDSAGVYVVQVASQAEGRGDPGVLSQESTFMSTHAEDHAQFVGHSKHTAGKRCACCQYADWIVPGFEDNETRVDPVEPPAGVKTDKIEVKEVFAGKKYKPVALKVRPVYENLPEEFRIERHIYGDPLENLKPLNPVPPDFEPIGRYTQERKEMVDKMHEDNFLSEEEMRLVHHLLMIHESAVAWTDDERGTFKEEFFPPVKFPVQPDHKVWVERNIPIPPGQLEEVCKVLRASIDANIYEGSNSAYRTKYFGVLKSDKKSIRLVHSLEPLNAVTIAHSGVPPGAANLAEHFAGRACGTTFDLYSGYNHRLIHPDSRDYTTFQSPFGALRLVRLPQGWTNSVPIFHEDVTYILRDEIPHVTWPYIDDIPMRGPPTRYEKADGTEERIPENPGIRRFVWEHLNDCNRILTRLNYCGATVSGKKLQICRSIFKVVGHVCSYDGMKPDDDRIGAIQRWGPLHDFHEVKAFLGTIGVMRMFIKDFSILAEPIQRLTRASVDFEWGPRQEASMQALKESLNHCEALRPINYDWDTDVVLAVDTSYMAIGIHVYQCDPIDPKKKYYARFHTLPMNEREARYSQPKRELFGLKRALDSMSYWLLGCRRLVVETDAQYLKGMLDHPGMGPNATINRWIEEILMFHFTLKHVPGKTFGPDGLSRRPIQPGDPVYPDREIEYDNNESPELHPASGDWPPLLDYEVFKEKIDTRGGFLIETRPAATSIEDFSEELEAAELSSEALEIQAAGCYIDVLAQTKKKKNPVKLGPRPEGEPLIPDLELKYDPEKREPYVEDHRSEAGKSADEKLVLIRDWWRNTLVRPAGMNDVQYKSFLRFASSFFLDESGRLYRKAKEGSAHQLVVDKDHRMFMMRAAHDSLGHRGFWATKSLIELRFWWPELERDVSWYVKTCELCQLRQQTLLKIPPVVTYTPSLFQQVHIDVMTVGTPSNGFNKIVDARCALCSWLEARPIKNENARTLALFILEEIICRWGCPEVLVTDNAPAFLAAVAYLSSKYGIHGIRVSPYNSQGNGKVENGHWPLRQALYKATGGNPSKWFWFLPQVQWADRVTIRRGTGCSPYFIATGAHPTLPLDIEEATWLVNVPGRILTTGELIGYRAQALAKHATHIEQMRERVTAEKRAAVRRYEVAHEHTIKDYNFLPGDLVLVRNTMVEKSLNTKMATRYLGPVIIIRRTHGGSYVVAEMDGSVFQNKIGQFRVVPYAARKSIKLPDNIHDLIDLSPETLESMIKDEGVELYAGRDYQFENVRLGVNDNYTEPQEESDEELVEDEFSSGTESEGEAQPRTRAVVKARTKRKTEWKG